LNEDCLKLTIYFGERDRLDGQFLADRLLDIYEDHGLAVSVLMRGVEGFGVKHHLRTDRLLTLSEDLPVVAVAVDTRERIERVLAEVGAINFDGLVTIERARMLTGEIGAVQLPDDPYDATKLTLYFGRGMRINGSPAYEAALDRLHRSGVDGATVLLGVDGTVSGTRRRARFLSRNTAVPVMVISVGSGERIATVVPELASLLNGPVMTLERVRVLKRDGRLLADPGQVPERDELGLRLWQKLMLHSSEQARFGAHPVHVEAIRRLRREGAAGTTALRGVWGYDGRHAPHGDTLWSLRRRVPTLTVVVDTPPNIRRWADLLDRVTPERGLITSEIVPAFRATGPEITRGGLRLASLWRG
jgi:PII-like signaling protein